MFEQGIPAKDHNLDSDGSGRGANNPLSEFCTELVRGAVYAGGIKPINSVRQILNEGAKLLPQSTDGSAGRNALPEVEWCRAKDNASAAERSGREIGEMGGTVLQLLMLRRALDRCLQEAPVSSMFKNVTAGALQGGLLSPLGYGENNWDRIGHGAAAALTFATMEGSASLLAGRVGGSALLQSALSGAAGGAVQLQSESLFNGDGWRPIDETFNAALGGMAGAAAFHGIGRMTSFTGEFLKSRKSGALINEFGDSYVQTTGRHGPDISSQRVDDLDQRALDYVSKLVADRGTAGGAVRVLDLGGGTGGQSKRLAKLGADVTLVDLSDQHSAVAAFNQELGSNRINFLRQDMRTIDVNGLSQQPFDVIYSQRSMQFIPYNDAHTLLSSLVKANPGARMYLSTVGLAAEDGIGYAHASRPIEQRFAPLRDDLARKISCFAPMALYLKEDMQRLLSSAGIVDTELWLSASGNVKATGVAGSKG